MKSLSIITLRIISIFLFSLIGWLLYQNGKNKNSMADENQKIALLKEKITKMETNQSSVPNALNAQSPPVASRENTLTSSDIAIMNLKFEKNKNNAPESAAERNAKSKELMDGLKTFSINDVRVYLASVMKSNDLDVEMKRSLMQMVFGGVYSKNPKETCDLLIEYKNHLTNENFTTIHLIGRCLTEMSSVNPLDSLQWLRDHYQIHAKVIDQSCVIDMIKSVSVRNRKLAFQLIEEFQIYPLSNITQSIMSAAKSDEDKIAAVADLREFMKTIEDEEERKQGTSYAIASIGRTKAMEGFDKAMAWGKSAGLTKQEWGYYAGDLGEMVLDGDQGKWLSLMHDKSHEWSFFASSVRGIMAAWFATDQKAATAWLDAAPDGFVKDQCCYTFSINLAARQTNEAANWAGKIKNATLRQDTLHRMYHQLPTNTSEEKAAAAAFEKENQIKHSTGCDPNAR